MSSYKIYLTKSSEVAGLIARARGGELKTDDVISISHGHVNTNEKIPAIYHEKDYFYCIVELNNNSRDRMTYELIIC
ncbi:MAG: hypothetical protein K9L62_00560 [Vallitaleaceae bacterium]|nr:hypothetical protein [Vallitaleaceae bacterium]